MLQKFALFIYLFIKNPASKQMHQLIIWDQYVTEIVKLKSGCFINLSSLKIPQQYFVLGLACTVNLLKKLEDIP